MSCRIDLVRVSVTFAGEAPRRSSTSPPTISSPRGPSLRSRGATWPQRSTMPFTRRGMLSGAFNREWDAGKTSLSGAFSGSRHHEAWARSRISKAVRSKVPAFPRASGRRVSPKSLGLRSRTFAAWLRHVASAATKSSSSPDIWIWLKPPVARVETGFARALRLRTIFQSQPLPQGRQPVQCRAAHPSCAPEISNMKGTPSRTTSCRDPACP